MRRLLLTVVPALALGLLTACDDDSSADAGASDDAGPSGDAGSAGTADTTSTGGETTSAGEGDGDGSDTAGDGDGDGDGDVGGVTCDGPCPTQWPEPTGVCPEIRSGIATFAPAGIPPRDVKLWVGSDTESQDGPLIFYWHGTGSQPDEALAGLSTQTVQAVTDMGGMVAAPTSDPAAGTFPWFLTSGSRLDDLILADEILACMIEQIGVDGRRIHVSGMSAGGLMTTQMSYRRSSYIASVVSYSGGIIIQPPPYEDPSNKFAAMMKHGGPNDIVVINFKDATESYFQAMTDNGQYAVICDHGMGHTIDFNETPSVWQFMQDHPYGTEPSPYEGMPLPEIYPDYCTTMLPAP